MNQVARLGDRAARIARATIPDPFIIAIALGLIAIVAGLLTGEAGPLDLCKSYATGMFAANLLAFAFKMALILVTGHALAAARPVRRVLERLAGIPRTTAGAALMVAAVALVLGLLNWGVGLVGGAGPASKADGLCPGLCRGHTQRRRNFTAVPPLLWYFGRRA